MGCNCNKRKDLIHARRVAKIFANSTKQNVQIFTYLLGNQRLYNFEPINSERENIIEIIKWV